MRTMLWLLAVLALTAGTVSAQVAAPSLITGTTGFNSPRNPAALSWDRTQIHVGGGPAEVTVPTAPVSPAADGNTTMLNARWVGEMIAAGAESTKLNLDVDPLFGGGTIEADTTTVGVALQFAEVVSVGYGQFNEEFGGTAITNPDSDEVSTVGATLRLGELVYLGFGVGDSHTEQGTLNEADQEEQIAGVGVLWRDGDSAFHLEAFMRNREVLVDPISGRDEEDVEGFTIEAILSGILIGYVSGTEEKRDAVGILNETQEATTVSVGWVPQQGLTVAFQQMDLDILDGAGVVNQTFSFQSVVVGWAF